MSNCLTVPLTLRSTISFNNHFKALVINPSNLTLEDITLLKDHGYQVYGVESQAILPDHIKQQLTDCFYLTLSKLTGFLGRFEAFALLNEKQENLGELHQGEGCYWDIVIDAGKQRLFEQEVAPLGYVHYLTQLKHTASSTSVFADWLAQYQQGFAKPKYFDYKPEFCAHFRLGNTGCQRCIQACPALAIQSNQGQLTFDANLCQGCGTCTLVCPTGAVSYSLPQANEILAKLQQVLATQSFQQLRITTEHLAPKQQCFDLVLPELLSLGAELWLNALVIGFSTVVIMPSSTLTKASDTALKREVSLWQSILGNNAINIGECVKTDLPEKRNTFTSEVDFSQWPTTKQALIYFALEKLLPTNEVSNTIVLAKNAPMGQVSIDQQACSECLACAQLCPLDALQAKQESSLWFDASRCVQCGICEQGCPEHAISLSPMLDIAQLSEHQATKLFDVSMAHCKVCQQPFMSQKVIDSILDKLADDTAINPDLVLTCPTCRVDAFYGFNNAG